MYAYKQQSFSGLVQCACIQALALIMNDVFHCVWPDLHPLCSSNLSTCPSPAPPLPIQGMLDYLEKLTMPQIRKLYSIISSLAQDEDSALWVGWMGTQALVCLRMCVHVWE